MSNSLIGTKKLKIAVTAVLSIAIVAGIFYWVKLRRKVNLDSIYSGNGRIEAIEILISTKLAGRLESINVDEGDFVKEGQILAVIDSRSLEAQMEQAKAQLMQAEASYEASKVKAKRSSSLVKDGASSQQEVDDDKVRVKTSLAAVSVAKAAIQRLQVDLDDSTLKAPRDGRIQFRVAQPGEIMAAGSRILTLLDLTDVYMTFFLPTEATGKLALGSEARIILDAAKEYTIKAKISFISDEAQFTPKSVETSNEREKLMFRIKAKIPSELLKKHIQQVKTGLPGIAYVKLDDSADWPEKLNHNIVE
jgi:HlyD family secretion protein